MNPELKQLLDENPVAYEMWREQEWKRRISKIEAQIKPDVLRKEIYQVFLELINNCDVLCAKAYDEYAELSKKGLSFKERLSVIDSDRVERIKAYKEKLKIDSKSFRAVPLHEWLQDGDYEYLKFFGFRKFLRMYFLSSYHVDN